MLVASCKPADVVPVLPAPRVETPRWPGPLEPEEPEPTRWSGYPPDVQAQFERAHAVLGEALDGWTIGSLAPALLDWVPPGESREVWLSVSGSPCELAIIERPEEQAEVEVDVLLWARFGFRETTENGERLRSFESGSIGHEVRFGNGGGEERWDGERWVEHSGYGFGEPPRIWSTLSSVSRTVARFEAPRGLPVVECDSPKSMPCDGGGYRLCPSCDSLRVVADDGRMLGVSASGSRCPDACPPRGPDHPELPFLRQLLRRYGGFQDPAGDPPTLMFRDEAQCRAEVVVVRDSPWPEPG